MSSASPKPTDFASPGRWPLRSSLGVAVVVVVLVVAVLYRDRLPQLADLKAQIVALAEWRARAPLQVALVFFLTYVAAAAVSLPVVTVMTLAVGALFGFWEGVVLVSFASSLGALLAFLAGRLVLGEAVARRFGPRLGKINEGIARDGAFYLFSLRLIPLFPFFVVNLAMSLTPIRAWTFYWVTQVGTLAGTMVYVNAGTQLARLDSLSGILSPGLLASFTLLGLFPWLARALVDGYRRRRVYARWTRPRTYDRNLIVIGAGAAGLVSTYIAAVTRAKVTLVEAGKMGGDCLNYGCIPSKALIRSAKLAHQMRHADRYGLAPTSPAVPFRAVMARIRAVIAEIAPHDSVERYTALGAEVLSGTARIRDPWTVEVTHADGSVRRLTTRAIIVATGARPFVPPLPGIEEAGYVTSDTLWEHFAGLEAPPRRLVVLGGGPIGSELAQAFARLGSQVTQVEMAPRLLMREDEDVAEFARRALEGDGVEVLTGHTALACERDGDDRVLVVEAHGERRRIGFDALICAVGRTPRLTGFGLEDLGIPVGRTIETNAWLETLYPNILAAGDVAGPYQFTHVAAHQAWYASVNALFGGLRRFKVDYRVIPWTTFIDPEIARVGLNEQEARAQGIAHEVTRYGLDDLDRAIADSAAQGFVKVLTEPGKDRILGVTIAGEHAGEILAEFVLAMKHGLGLNRILGTIHTYPTFAEANKYAAGTWKRAHVSPRTLAWLEWFHRLRRGEPRGRRTGGEGGTPA